MRSAAQRGQRDVEDGVVDGDHQQAGDQDAQRLPASCVRFGLCDMSVPSEDRAPGQPVARWGWLRASRSRDRVVGHLTMRVTRDAAALICVVRRYDVALLLSARAVVDGFPPRPRPGADQRRHRVGVIRSRRPLPGGPAYVGAPAVPHPVPPPAAAAPVPGSGPRRQHPQRRVPDRRLPRSRTVGDLRGAVNAAGRRVRVDLFDRRGRLETVASAQPPTLKLFDPDDAEAVGVVPPAATALGLDVFTDFSGGGYFYLDHRDRAVIPTGPAHPGGRPEPRGHRLRAASATTTSPSAMAATTRSSRCCPRGRASWCSSPSAAGGRDRPGTGAVRSAARPDDHELVRRRRDRRHLRRDHRGALPAGLCSRTPRGDVARGVSQRRPTSRARPPPVRHHPTLMNDEWVAITDNADPMNIVVYRRAPGDRRPRGLPGAGLREGRQRHRQLAHRRRPGAGRRPTTTATTGRSRRSPAASPTPGIERVDIDARRPGLSAGSSERHRAVAVRGGEAVARQRPGLHRHRGPQGLVTRGTSARSTSGPVERSSSGGTAPASATTSTTRRSAWAGRRGVRRRPRRAGQDRGPDHLPPLRLPEATGCGEKRGDMGRILGLIVLVVAGVRAFRWPLRLRRAGVEGLDPPVPLGGMAVIGGLGRTPRPTGAESARGRALLGAAIGVGMALQAS